MVSILSSILYFLSTLSILILATVPQIWPRILRLPCKKIADFRLSFRNTTLSSPVLRDLPIEVVYECVKTCLLTLNCKTISVNLLMRRCRLYDKNSTDVGVSLVPDGGWALYQTNWSHKKVKSDMRVS